MGFFCFLFSSLFFYWPHGDLQLRIDEISQSIILYPDSLSLYQSRGELYIQHEEFSKARQDFSYCLQKGFTNANVLEGMSRSLITNNDLYNSLHYINLALVIDSTSTSAQEWKARVLFLLKQYCESGQVYEDLINHTTSPSPSLYIDASTSWMQCSESTGYQHAIDILMSGLDRIGPLHVLQKELVRDYLQRKDFKSALIVQTDLIDHAINKALPLYDRARIYQSTGQKLMARDDLQKALELFDQLPDHKKNLPAMVQMKEKIEMLFTQLQE
jgi:tetratricopeptide (TPR) repeat protein